MTDPRITASFSLDRGQPSIKIRYERSSGSRWIIFMDEEEARNLASDINIALELMRESRADG